MRKSVTQERNGPRSNQLDAALRPGVIQENPLAASAETWRSLDDEGLYATRGWLGDSTPMIFIVQKELDEKWDGYEREKIGAGLGCPLGLWPFVQR